MTNPIKNDSRPFGVTRGGIIAEARAHRLLEDANPELHRLFPEAVAGGAAVAFLVTDPREQIVDDPNMSSAARERQEQLVAFAAGKPLTALVPVELIVGLLRPLGELEEVAHIIRRITVERDPSIVPVIFQVGPTFGIVEVDPVLVAVASAGSAPRDAAIEERVIAGVLEGFFGIELAPGEDETLSRYQERCRVLLAAEESRGTGRPVGEVLIAGFGGDDLRAAWASAGGPGLRAQIDRVLASLGEAS